MNGKKFFAMLLAVVMVFSVGSITAFAGVTDTDTNPYNKVKVNKTYNTTIQLFGTLTVYDEETDAYVDKPCTRVEHMTVDFSSPEGQEILNYLLDEFRAEVCPEGATLSSWKETDRIYYTSRNIVDSDV